MECSKTQSLPDIHIIECQCQHSQQRRDHLRQIWNRVWLAVYDIFQICDIRRLALTVNSWFSKQCSCRCRCRRRHRQNDGHGSDVAIVDEEFQDFDGTEPEVTESRLSHFFMSDVTELDVKIDEHGVGHCFFLLFFF